MRFWIDVENAPQVQYLIPFKHEFEKRGHEVTVTCREAPIVLELLSLRNIEPVVVPGPRSSSRARKAAAIFTRAAQLARLAHRMRFDISLSSSRPAMIASRASRIPSASFCDYEYVDLRIPRHTRSYVLHPDVICEEAFMSHRIGSDYLIPFPGLKEEITFASTDLEGVRAIDLGLPPRETAKRVLFRPPGETTHYFVPESRELAIEAVRYLAARTDLVVIYNPRDPAQLTYLDGVSWHRDPVVVTHGLPFEALFKTIDAVVSSGGTMVREAAYLGMPSYSILRSHIGRVDSYLESVGRLTIIESRDDLPKIGTLDAAKGRLPARVPDLLGHLADTVVGLAQADRGPRSAPARR